MPRAPPPDETATSVVSGEPGAAELLWGQPPKSRSGGGMILSMDVAAGVLDICLGLAAVVLIAVLASRQRRRARDQAPR